MEISSTADARTLDTAQSAQEKLSRRSQSQLFCEFVGNAALDFEAPLDMPYQRKPSNGRIDPVRSGATYTAYRMGIALAHDLRDSFGRGVALPSYTLDKAAQHKASPETPMNPGTRRTKRVKALADELTTAKQDIAAAKSAQIRLQRGHFIKTGLRDDKYAPNTKHQESLARRERRLTRRLIRSMNRTILPKTHE